MQTSRDEMRGKKTQLERGRPTLESKGMAIAAVLIGKFKKVDIFP